MRYERLAAERLAGGFPDNIVGRPQQSNLRNNQILIFACKTVRGEGAQANVTLAFRLGHNPLPEMSLASN